MREFNGTDIKVTAFDYDVYARQTNVLKVEKLTENVDHFTVNDVVYQFYQDTIEVDVSDLMRASIGVESTINVWAPIDSISINFKAIDGFEPKTDIIPPTEFLAPDNVNLLFYFENSFSVNFRIKGLSSWMPTENYPSKTFLTKIFNPSKYELIRIISNGKTYYFKPITEFCGRVEKLKWLADCGPDKELYFFVENEIIGSDENLYLMNLTDSWKTRKNKFIDYNLLLPKADFRTWQYVADIITSNKVMFGDIQVFVDNSEIEIPTSDAFKPSDLRLKVRVKHYDL